MIARAFSRACSHAHSMTDKNARGFAHTRDQFQQLAEDGLLRRYTVIERGGMRFGIFGVLGKEAMFYTGGAAPAKFTGTLLGDMATKRAQVENQDTLPGDLNVLVARAPLSEVAKYAAQLGGMTQGQGSYTLEFSHYEQVPATVQQQVVTKAAVKHAEE